jgi:hypothetical protein
MHSCFRTAVMENKIYELTSAPRAVRFLEAFSMKDSRPTVFSQAAEVFQARSAIWSMNLDILSHIQL